MYTDKAFIVLKVKLSKQRTYTELNTYINICTRLHVVTPYFIIVAERGGKITVKNLFVLNKEGGGLGEGLKAIG